MILNMDTETNDKGIEILANPEKIIPKFATSVNFTKFENGNIVISFVSSPDQKTGSLIETIMVDTAHAKQIIEVLSKVISDAK